MNPTHRDLRLDLVLITSITVEEPPAWVGVCGCEQTSGRYITSEHARTWLLHHAATVHGEPGPPAAERCEGVLSNPAFVRLMDEMWRPATQTPTPRRGPRLGRRS